ncbi:BCCT family transporter [Christiangramia sabulilitoris]|uniref:BCCT family transporter n=1 Tax=Christiangramia sabulilitoris TaxID=2583991 RepID=A0A550I3V2_9FLAO|nr:BCCT family transporter [Christiangramia sabulilitoris]TRO65654.1 BCCT family transporter [Christiangramia sabulilitoris]
MKLSFNSLTKNKVFLTSAVLLILSSVLIFIFTNEFYNSIEETSLWVRNYFGTFYLWLGLGCVLFLLLVAISKFGRIRLGNSPPEFDRLSWIAMLYSAGMGAGILLRAVQEPVYMFLNPPIETGEPLEIISLEYTFYQWGFTAWAFYGLFALVIGYSIFVDKADIRLSSGFNSFSKLPFLPATIDILTILTTVIGLVAAIGLGTTQIEGGLSHLESKEPGSLIQNMGLVFMICSLAFLSAWAGVSKGIRRISNWNIYITILLLLFVFAYGNIPEILLNFFSSLYHYIVDFIPLSLAFGDYDPGVKFLTDWTYYYWAFWLAWAPFTGIFIARISRGRTIREMIFGVLLIPSLGSFFWFSVFGTSAFELIEKWKVYNNEFSNVFTSMFIFFENYPLPIVTSFIVIVLLISFLVTSVDSAIFVLSMFTDHGRKEPRKRFRLAWAILILIFCEAIIVLGHVKPNSNVLTAMQKFLIISSLPFAIFSLIIIMLFGRKLYRRRSEKF